MFTCPRAEFLLDVDGVRGEEHPEASHQRAENLEGEGGEDGHAEGGRRQHSHGQHRSRLLRWMFTMLLAGQRERDSFLCASRVHCERDSMLLASNLTRKVLSHLHTRSGNTQPSIALPTAAALTQNMCR